MLRVHQQVISHLVRNLGPEVTVRAVQQKHTEGGNYTDEEDTRPQNSKSPPLICSMTVGASPWRGAPVQRNHRVFGPRHVVAVDNNNTISNTQPAANNAKQQALRATRAQFLLDHVSGVGSGATAAVQTQQAADMSRVVSGEVRRVGSTLQTHQTLHAVAPAGDEHSQVSARWHAIFSPSHDQHIQGVLPFG